MMVLRKLYKENVRSIYMDGKAEEQPDELAKFKESMNILNLDQNQLKDFISATTARRMDDARRAMDDDLDKFEKELAAGEQMNGNRLYKMVAEVIEDRLHKPSN